MDGDILENTSSVDTDIFLYGEKKMYFQKYPDQCGSGHGLQLWYKSCTCHDRKPFTL